MSGELLANVIVFGRALRAAGVPVRSEAVPDALRALDLVGVTNRADVRDALRTVFVSRQDDFLAFDAMFESFWRARSGAAGVQPEPMRVPDRARARVRTLGPSIAAGEPSAEEQTTSDAPVGVRTYSAAEAWRR